MFIEKRRENEKRGRIYFLRGTDPNSEPGPDFDKTRPVSSHDVIPPMRSTVKQGWNVRLLSQIVRGKPSEPMPFDCEHIIYRSVGRLIAKEK
jgi:hypothetical protein